MATQMLVNSAERLQFTFYVDGVATDTDDMTATVTITADDGTAIATDAATTRTDQGVYTYQETPLTELDRLTAVWAGVFSGQDGQATQYVDVVGGYFVSLAEIRAMKNLESTATFTTAELIEARQWFETLAERYCGQAFVPRYRKQRFSGNGTATIFAERNVRTVRSVRDYSDATTYTAFTDAEVADINVDPNGWLTRLSTGAWGCGTRNLEVVYEVGMDAVPDDLRLAAKNAIRHRLLDDETGHRPYAEQTDVGFLRFSRPGPNRPTGDDDIDTILNAYKLIAVG